VELLAGKTVKLDAVNRYFFGGSIRPETVEGWGTTRWVVSALGPMAGTLVAVPPEEPKIDRFIAIGGEPLLVRYDSRLPIVVYRGRRGPVPDLERRRRDAADGEGLRWFTGCPSTRGSSGG